VPDGSPMSPNIFATPPHHRHTHTIPPPPTPPPTLNPENPKTDSLLEPHPPRPPVPGGCSRHPPRLGPHRPHPRARAAHISRQRRDHGARRQAPPAAAALAALNATGGIGTGGNGAGTVIGGSGAQQQQQQQQQLLVVGDGVGVLHLMAVPRTLRRPLPGEAKLMGEFVRREGARVAEVGARQVRFECGLELGGVDWVRVWGGWSKRLSWC